jgi:phosphoribosylglycinamide formyltransferase-1
MGEYNHKPLISLVILVSGRGSNAESIVQYFSQNKMIKIVGIWTNSSKSGILDRKMGVEIRMFSAGKDDDSLLALWRKESVDAIILAGYLKPIPLVFLNHFKNKIINIHPALLPKYGGKGMYGMNVHRSVIENNETESGISIHYVNKNYDEGKMIFQASCAINAGDSPEDLANKIRLLEHQHYPKVIEETIKNSAQ